MSFSLHRYLRAYVFVMVLVLLRSTSITAQSPVTTFRILAIAERGGLHQPFVNAAKVWLQKEASIDNFTIDYIEDTKPIDAAYLSQYQLFIQINYPPYNWTPTAAAAFPKAIEDGSIGWIGFHHATLLGVFDGFPMWSWFSHIILAIRVTID